MSHSLSSGDKYIHIIHAQVKILRADSKVYVAETDGKMLMKMGPGSYSPPSADWSSVAKGKRWAIWERTT